MFANDLAISLLVVVRIGVIFMLSLQAGLMRKDGFFRGIGEVVRMVWNDRGA